MDEKPPFLDKNKKTGQKTHFGRPGSAFWTASAFGGWSQGTGNRGKAGEGRGRPGKAGALNRGETGEGRGRPGKAGGGYSLPLFAAGVHLCEEIEVLTRIVANFASHSGELPHHRSKSTKHPDFPFMSEKKQKKEKKCQICAFCWCVSENNLQKPHLP